MQSSAEDFLYADLQAESEGLLEVTACFLLLGSQVVCEMAEEVLNSLLRCEAVTERYCWGSVVVTLPVPLAYILECISTELEGMFAYLCGLTSTDTGLRRLGVMRSGRGNHLRSPNDL